MYQEGLHALHELDDVLLDLVLHLGDVDSELEEALLGGGVGALAGVVDVEEVLGLVDEVARL